MRASYIDTRAIPAVRQVLKQRAEEGVCDYVCNVRSFATRVDWEIALNRFHPSDEAVQVIDVAMAFSSLSEGVIFDLRETVGGSPELVSYLAGYFYRRIPPFGQYWIVTAIRLNLSR